MDRTTPGMSQENRGLWYGLRGVFAFSLTLPMTRLAVASFDPVFIGLGRALVAALLAVLLLKLTRQPLPTRPQLRSLALVAGGVILGFPLLSAWAVQRVPSSHGAVITGLLPLATALAAVWRAGDRPSRSFWAVSGLGSLVVVGFALRTGAGRLQPADLALLGAVAAAAVGYAEGGRLSRELGGWQVISWALVLAAPIIALPVAVAIYRHPPAGPWQAWAAFAYVAIISQFLGFFAWYRGLALGGIARVSQIQLLQPFLTIVAAAVLLHEIITPLTIGTAILVMILVAAGKRTTIAGGTGAIAGMPEEVAAVPPAS